MILIKKILNKRKKELLILFLLAWSWRVLRLVLVLLVLLVVVVGGISCGGGLWIGIILIMIELLGKRIYL